MQPTKKRIGILGFGESGKYIVNSILTDASVAEKLEIVCIESATSSLTTEAFVWNRSKDVLKSDPRIENLILDDITKFEQFKPDMVVEVAHPIITKQYAKLFLESGCDYFIGSPSCLSDEEIEKDLKKYSLDNNRVVFIPVGALWGAMDIQKMADRKSLVSLTLTMKIHPDSLKLVGELADKLKEVENNEGEQIIYSGPVRQLCKFAPNNVNTMACAAIAGHNLGFDKTIGVLVADNSLKAHIIEEIDIEGPDKGELGKFTLKTVRRNPALPGAVTGTATLASFLNSILNTFGHTQPGFQIC